VATFKCIPASGGGSCVRCQRSLGLTAVERDGQWYGTATCADGGDCPFDRREPEVPEPALYGRPRRFFHKRLPKELKAASGR
jgi:hypothetical protein